ncbi:hypothetical protein AVEN_181999-1 [Araneus ventricosus]|uniref:Uncharacterized protein n=1 Tax=Araneus ventricosus TaxID=182803 RepID=A0A4Y2CKU1_ARAVE|nr:hypothetical protein AVEN_181999-1 [Araneus ventricosus]
MFIQTKALLSEIFNDAANKVRLFEAFIQKEICLASNDGFNKIYQLGKRPTLPQDATISLLVSFSSPGDPEDAATPSISLPHLICRRHPLDSPSSVSKSGRRVRLSCLLVIPPGRKVSFSSPGDPEKASPSIERPPLICTRRPLAAIRFKSGWRIRPLICLLFHPAEKVRSNPPEREVCCYAELPEEVESTERTEKD